MHQTNTDILQPSWKLACVMENPITTQFDPANRTWKFKRNSKLLGIMTWSYSDKCHIFKFSNSDRQLKFDGKTDASARQAIIQALYMQ